MTMYVDYMLKVPAEAIERLKDEKTVEIVLRDMKKRYKPFIKAAVQEAKGIDPKKAQEVLKPIAAKAVKKKDLEGALHVVRNIDKHINVVGGMVKNVSNQLADLSLDFDDVFKKMGSIEELNYLNVALNGLNLAATIAGFVVVYNMLNELDNKLQSIDAKLDKLVDNEMDKINQRYHDLVMRFNSMYTKIKDHDAVNRDELEGYLRDTNTFIKDRLISSIVKETFDEDVMLTMINTLLPSYTLILIEFQKDYYYGKHRAHDNNPVFMSLFEDLQSKNFTRSVYDYLFLKHGMHADEALAAVALEKIFINGQLIDIYDQNILFRDVADREKFEELNQIINEGVKEYAVNLVKQKSEMDEVDYSAILPAIEKAYQATQFMS